MQAICSSMTADEARCFERARQRGFLCSRPGQRCLTDAWTGYCQQQNQVCVRLERQGSVSRLLVSTGPTDPLSDLEQSALRALLGQFGAPAPGSLYPIVFRQGAYSQALEPARAEAAAAHVVAHLRQRH